MKNTILAFGLLCAFPALGTNILPTSEENAEAPSKATRFQETFPEMTELQGQIFGPFSIYFGAKISDFEVIKIPALETKISEETDENIIFYLNIQKEKYEKKRSKYKSFQEAMDRLPELYTFLLNEIEADSYLHFTAPYYYSNDQILETFHLHINNPISAGLNDMTLLQKLQEAGLEETVLFLNQFSRHSHKALKDHKKDFLSEYKAMETLVPEITGILSKISPELLTPEKEAQLIKEIKAERAFTLRKEYNIKTEEQQQLYLIFTFLNDYFLIPLEQFRKLLAHYPKVNDEEFDTKLQELRNNSEND